jgi:hypothetical protein
MIDYEEPTVSRIRWPVSEAKNVMVRWGRWVKRPCCCAKRWTMEDHAVKQILEGSRTIAVVGLSPKEDRPSYGVASYLKAQGYRIVPVNPGVAEVLGEKAYPSLDRVPPDIRIDVVDVFRRPEEALPIAEQAVERGARVLWLQEGIVNDEAAETARRGGLRVVMNRCMLKEHKRLLNPGG